MQLLWQPQALACVTQPEGCGYQNEIATPFGLAMTIEVQMSYKISAVLVFTSIIWSISAVIIKAGLYQFHPRAFILGRFTILTALALIVMLIKDADIRIQKRDLKILTISAIVGFTIYQFVWVYGLSFTTAFSTQLIVSASPVFSAVILMIAKMENIHKLQWIGITTSFAGMVIFVSEKMEGFKLAEAGFGDLLVLGSSICFAIYGIINKPILARYSASKIMGYSTVLALAMLFPFCIKATIYQPWGNVTLFGWFMLVYAGIFPVYLAFLLWNWGISRVGVAKTTVYYFLSPVLGALFAHLILGEEFGVRKILGAVIVLLGMFLARRQ